jgi:hypothetical protein
MKTPATPNEPATPSARVLWMACARREKTWKLGCTTGPGHKPRARRVAARHQERVRQAVAQATPRFGLPDSASGVRGDAAGRAGVWRHRLLRAPGRTTPGVDASSLAVTRRQRRATSEGWAIRQWLRMRRRVHPGAREVGRVVPGPTGAAEDQRHRHRDLDSRTQERARTTPRLKGVRRSQGRRLTSLRQGPAPRDARRRWAGAPRPRGRRRRVLRV